MFKVISLCAVLALANGGNIGVPLSYSAGIPGPFSYGAPISAPLVYSAGQVATPLDYAVPVARAVAPAITYAAPQSITYSHSTLSTHPPTVAGKTIAAPLAYVAEHVAAPVAYTAGHDAAPVAYSAYPGHYRAPLAYSAGHVAAAPTLAYAGGYVL